MADNPKWKPFLDVLPSHLHAVVTPVLEQWDQGVTQKLQEVRDEYKPLESFKQFADANIDPQYLVQAYQLAEQVKENPADIIERMNSQFNLGYLTPDEAAALNTDSNDNLGLEDEMVNIEDHPKFKALQSGLEQLTTQFTELSETQSNSQQQQEFDQYMKELHESEGDFNDRFVTALIAQGLEGKEAIEEYRKEIGAAASNLTPEQIAELNKNNQQQNGPGQANQNSIPPVTLDGMPAGSGSDQQPVNFGTMSKTDVNSYVTQLLAAAGENQQ